MTGSMTPGYVLASSCIDRDDTEMTSRTRERVQQANVLLMLLKIREAFLQSFRPILAHFGLTEQQWRVLRILDEHGEMEQRELARRAQFLGPSLVGVLKRMEQLGMIRGASIDVDKRRRLISLTSKGKSLSDRARPLIKRQYRLIARHVGAAELSRLSSLLHEIDRKLHEPIPTISFGSDDRFEI